MFAIPDKPLFPFTVNESHCSALLQTQGHGETEMNQARWYVGLLLAAISLVGCGGGGGGNRTAPPIMPPGVDHVAVLETHLDDLNVANYAVVIGDANGVLLSREFGNFSVTESHFIASATKWLAAMVIMDLVEQGVMSLDDRPQDYLAWWTADPADPRSEITLEHLLSFTAGFNTGPDDASCVTDGSITLDDCARAFYDGGLAYQPGSTFYYGPAHLQIAGRMAEVATQLDFADLAILQQTIRFGLQSTLFLVPVGANPRIGGGAVSSAADYGVLMQSILSGSYLSGVVDEMERDRTGPPVVIGSRPPAIDNNNVDFRYALGHWRECAQPTWDSSCDSRRLSSSPGAFGWNPWIDFDNGDYGIIAMQENQVDGGSPTDATLAFSIALRPFIEAALPALRAQQ
ncbi:MAG: serine hydrolase [Proteobacteria bacterium]|nr:serine hydrolase [Pseudomonadota bacterium]